MNVTLYSTHCPKCIVLEKKLAAKNIEFTLVEDQDVMIEKGFMAAPMLEVDGEIMNFTQANEWLNNR